MNWKTLSWAAGGLLSKKNVIGTSSALGDPLQPASADPVDALFVFLHLVKRNADPVGDFGQRQAALQPEPAHAAPRIYIAIIRPTRANMLIDCIAPFHFDHFHRCAVNPQRGEFANRTA